nr:MAG TPA: hypothetical protein [Caudoviricetes sp.]
MHKCLSKIIKRKRILCLSAITLIKDLSFSFVTYFYSSPFCI